MKLFISLLLILLVSNFGYSQSNNTSDKQILALLNGGYTNVESMEYHKNKKPIVVKTKKVKKTTTRVSKKEVSDNDILNILNNGVSVNSVENTNNKVPKTSERRKIALTNTVKLPPCNNTNEGKMIFINSDIYSCSKRQWNKN